MTLAALETLGKLMENINFVSCVIIVIKIICSIVLIREMGVVYSSTYWINIAKIFTCSFPLKHNVTGTLNAHDKHTENTNTRMQTHTHTHTCTSHIRVHHMLQASMTCMHISRNHTCIYRLRAVVHAIIPLLIMAMVWLVI